MQHKRNMELLAVVGLSFIAGYLTRVLFYRKEEKKCWCDNGKTCCSGLDDNAWEEPEQ